jgi:hypothetical protein
MICSMSALASKKSRPHLDVERGWSGANEHFTQQNSNIDYKDDCSGKGLDLAGNLRILNFAPLRLGHLAPASEVAGRHTLPF